ncbi:indole-3-glycerol phosphate synthase [Corynebacterium phocae]|uniref:indole-3-glycerol-phosphate synthase n=1 Tax=Corynebacterium phocae TaxID=161895 RepID=A0A1L7D294_9CORY|nr:indole-3-glycerol phosphate synthase TrpC [Corynebacterium phocae]APT92276.1 indole-3-glycerol phosphate synthase [Corynebacterium phocae]KAA8725422.1 indole-3-glycerol-phosphate synthase [Corynebacterium phocae]
MNAHIAAPRSLAVDRIVAGVLEDVAAREAKVSFQDIKARSRSLSEPPRDAKKALLGPGCTVITELKRAVPYRGEITNLDSPDKMGQLAYELESVGVRLMAVQTDKRRFHGSVEDMCAVHSATTVPLICRDIIVDPYQIHEARCWGADMVPLQVELMDQARLVSLLDRIESLGMTALLEVRSSAEADRALEAGASVIGISAWSLESDAMYREAFANIVPGMPESVIKIAIGGIETGRNLLDYASHGADAVLVGESIVAANDPAGIARSLVAWGQHPSCPSRKG